MNNRRNEEKKRSPAAGQNEVSAWEWVAAAIGALIVAAALGYMTYYGLTHTSAPPVLVVEQLGLRPGDAGYHVRFRVRNEGGSTAAAAQIRGELIDRGSVVETSEATVDYVPEQSEREGGLFFQRNPTEFVLELRAVGYVAP